MRSAAHPAGASHWDPAFSERDRSERDIVVHVAVAATAASGNGTARCAADRTGGAEIAARLVAEAAASPTAATTVQHRQGRVEALQHDFGRVLLDAALVGPFAGLERTLDVNLGALLQILFGDLAEPFIEDHDAVPLRLFLALAGRLVAPRLRGGDAQIGDRPPVLGAADFRILAEISNQNDLVDASRHLRSPLRMPLNSRRPVRSPRSAVPVEATLYARRTLADDDQSVTPPVIPTYSIELLFVPDLFLAKPPHRCGVDRQCSAGMRAAVGTFVGSRERRKELNIQCVMGTRSAPFLLHFGDGL